MIYQKHKFLASVDDPNVEDERVEFVEDCFQDMPRRKFGWRMKVMLMEKEPCTFEPDTNPDIPKCIITSPNTADEDLNFQQNAQERQTGEGARSAAPPDCRVEYVCDTPPNGS